MVAASGWQDLWGHSCLSSGGWRTSFACCRDRWATTRTVFGGHFRVLPRRTRGGSPWSTCLAWLVPATLAASAGLRQVASVHLRGLCFGELGLKADCNGWPLRVCEPRFGGPALPAAVPCRGRPGRIPHAWIRRAWGPSAMWFGAGGALPGLGRQQPHHHRLRLLTSVGRN